MRRAILAAAFCCLLVGQANAATCSPGNGVAYTCDFLCPSSNCNLTGTPHATCNGWGNGADGKCVICGKTGAEAITGTDGDDVICGAGGDDTITGAAGHDILAGEGGEDSITDTSGNNVAYGGSADDTITTGSGDDVLFGDSGVDDIDAGGGNNFLDGGDDNDVLTSSQGNPAGDPCLAELVATMPDDFGGTQGENGWSYGYFVGSTFFPNTCQSSFNHTDCSNNYSGDGCNETSLNSFVMRDQTRDLVLMRGLDAWGTILPIDVEYKAGTAATYRAIGAFARASECTSGDGVRVVIYKNKAQVLLDQTIASSHSVDPDDPFSGTGVVTFDVYADLAVNETLDFAVFAGTYGSPANLTNDITALKVDIIQGIVLAGDDVLGSRLCGGAGNDTLSATGPGHQCLDGGGDASDDSCTYAYTGQSGSRDVGTARNCSSVTGSVSTRTAGCGCR